ncbi:MAG: hypothetical protein A2W91_04070 [Bacteroidetes bacterium GWF2_38_335]|nr:MAG: hypothetical protein A2W91_04070 [Bacteroidetes bacterium GWF2_38_335]OFY79127.1 MAG: hypothetical protein A2281_03405 [Bacteroidetes bacterium RIFOXYA12_FULL_38_20]HBS88786.1 hypothetical protein [Bacteroidales bacterium]
MAQVQIILPPMGEGITDATVTKLLVKKGDVVEADQPILEIATDKVDSELPTPEKGRIIKILVNEGEIVNIGSVVALIETDLNAALTEPVVVEQIVEQKLPESNLVVSTVENTAPPVKSSSGKYLSPLVKSIIKNENLSDEDIEKIPGSGADGKINKEDVVNYINKKSPQQTVTSQPEKPQKVVAAPITPVAFDHGKNVEVIEMDRMRRLIADHMVMSKHTAPHVTLFAEADVTTLVNWRLKNKEKYLKEYNEKLTFTPIFIEAIVFAVKDYPMVNVSVDGYNIIRKKTVNVGMATVLPNGNLIVPVIKNACEKSLRGIISSVNDLAGRARENKLQPDEIKGGTITLTNLGSFGGLTGTPIINQPESAIVSVGIIKKRPVVIETSAGDVIAVRHMMYLSLTHDHRVIDGNLAGLFLSKIVKFLENFDPERNI